jgi:hypothetical protein
MKLVVRAMGLLPSSGVVDEVLVDQLWFGLGQLAAAQALWVWLRWEMRERGSCCAPHTTRAAVGCGTAAAHLAAQGAI